MNYIARAWRYITRRPTKSILLMVTFFVIGNLVILGLGISSAAENAKILTRKQMRAVVSYEVDYQEYYKYVEGLTDENEIEEAYKHYPKITLETAEKLAKDERVKAYNLSLTQIAYSEGFQNVPVGNEESKRDWVSYGEDESGMAYVEPNISIQATEGNEMIEMAEGTYTIADGRFLTPDDNADEKRVCNITKALAEQNNLRVGDTVKVALTSPNEIKSAKEKLPEFNEDAVYMTMEIVGIFDNKNQVDPNGDNFRYMQPHESPQNIILTTRSAYRESYIQYMQEMAQYYSVSYGASVDDIFNQDLIDNAGVPSKVVYLLHDPLEVDRFVSDYSSDMAEYVRLNANNDTFKKLARPLDTLSFFASIIVWIVVVNAVIIISLVTALTLKTREYEIGVLLSIGVSKAKIVGQLFMELIVIALVGFTLATVSGSLIAGKVGDAVLNYQTEVDSQYASDDDSMGMNYYWGEQNYFTEVDQDTLLSQYHVSVSPLLIGEIYLLGTGVVLLAIVIPSVMIMRLNPKQILLEQN